MRISPELLTRLLLYSFIFGAILALINGAARALFAIIDGKSLMKSSKIENKIKNYYAREQEKRDTLKKFNGNNKKSFSEKTIKTVKLVYTFLVDFLLVVLGGLGIILLCYYLNYGELRGFCFIGLALGFVLIRVTLGKVIKCLFGEIFIALRFLLLWIFSMLLLPLESFLNFCKKLFKKFAIKIVNTLAKKRKLLYNKNEEMFICSLAENGFSVLENNESINEASKKAWEQKNEKNDKSK